MITKRLDVIANLLVYVCQGCFIWHFDQCCRMPHVFYVVPDKASEDTHKTLGKDLIVIVETQTVVCY